MPLTRLATGTRCSELELALTEQFGTKTLTSNGFTRTDHLPKHGMLREELPEDCENVRGRAEESEKKRAQPSSQPVTVPPG